MFMTSSDDEYGPSQSLYPIFPNSFFSSSTKNSSKKDKNKRLPYCPKEDINIVKYIVHHKYAFDVFENQMWQTMERANVCRIRTWQSMRERYFKHIKFDLKAGSLKFKFLSANDLTLLREGLKIDGDAKKVRAKSTQEQIYGSLSDISDSDSF